MTSLATLGEGAKIWEVPTFKELEQFNPYQASISDLTWSHDGTHFIIAKQNFYLILFKSPGCRLYLLTHILLSSQGFDGICNCAISFFLVL